MAKLNITKQIRQDALKLLLEKPAGIRYSELQRKIMELKPNYNSNTVNGAIWNIDVQFPEIIYKPDRGIFRHTKYRENIANQPDEPIITIPVEMPPLATVIKKQEIKKTYIKEDMFYKPFADWLVNELEECTKAIPLGGNVFHDKWGTPDVIGIRESKKSDILQFPTEIVSVEIKIDTNGLITAFGQACAYKIFSHKSYIVIPNDSQIEDISRLDTLCRQFGIGLILFDSSNIDNPNFEIRVRAIKHEPDMFFVNKNLKLIEDRLF